MVKAAESHAGEDKARKEKIEARNQLDTLIYQVEKDTKEWGDKISADAKSSVDSALERAKKALKQDDMDELTGARDQLMQAFSAAGQQFYQSQQPQPGAEPGAEAAEGEPQPASAGRPGEEDVVEADYEIVEEEKK